MDKLTLKADKRKIFGRKVKSLRAAGRLPANIYGKNIKSLAIQLLFNDFEKVYKKAGETGIIELVIGKEERPALIHNVQLDPVTDTPLHIDFRQVNLKEKIIADIPIELVGESPAEKGGLGTVVQYIDEIEVEALPTDLPESFEMDVSKLKEVDQLIQVKDIAVDKEKVKVKSDAKQIIVKVEPPREEEEMVPPMEEVVEEEISEVSEGVPAKGEEKPRPKKEAVGEPMTPRGEPTGAKKETEGTKEKVKTPKAKEN
jgi:large subunit ribosomal protein L25